MDIGRFSLFKGAKNAPNRFNYTSKFYDSESEEFSKRLSRLDREMAKKEENQGPSGSISFQRKSSGKEYRSAYKKQANVSNLIIIGLVLILCLISYYIISEF